MTKETSSSSERNQDIYNFLFDHPVGVLATVDASNEPHAAVIYFSIEEDFSVRFMTKRDTKKHDSLQRNKHASLVVFNAKNQTTAQIFGSTEEITDDVEADKAFRGMLEAAQKTSEDEPPLSKLQAGHYVAYRLKPTQIKFVTFMRPDPGGYEMFETIDF